MEKWRERLQEWHAKSQIPIKMQIMIVVLIGILLMIVSVPTKLSRHFPSTSNMQEKKYNPSCVEYEEYMESKISKALKHVEGVGENEVIITLKSPKPDQKNFFVEEQKQASEVEGVLVIMDGGNQALISKNTIEAIEALFGIDAHKIKIMKRTAVK